jgi:Flp pilus assembly pilin Flp
VEFGLVVAAMAAMILAVVFGVGRVVGSALQPACDGLAAHTTPQGVCVSDPRSQPATGS